MKQGPGVNRLEWNIRWTGQSMQYNYLQNCEHFGLNIFLACGFTDKILCMLCADASDKDSGG